MNLQPTVIILLFCNLALTLAASYSKCCDGQNVLTYEKRCLDGTSIKQLACKDKQRIMMYANYSEMKFDEEGNLVEFFDYDDYTSTDEYCFAKSSGDNYILVICYEEENTLDIRIINVVFSIISVVFIILTITVYVSLPQLLDTQGICLIQSITGLAISFIVLGVINLSREISYHYCRILAYLMYFSFIYAFFWLNILCFHIWRTVVNPKILHFTRKWRLIYHMVGIVGPVLLLMVVLTANYSGNEFFRGIHPGIGEVKCWFKSETATFIYFYGPISILLCINIFYFIWTTIVLCREMKGCSQKKTKVQKFRLLLCVRLFFVMGISWCFEVLSALFETSTSKWVWVLPDALNALQGFLIFLILVVFRKKIIRALANKKIFRSIKLPSSWKNAQDDECEDIEEELSLSGVHEHTTNIPA